MVNDTKMVEEHVTSKKQILSEGAQAIMLDVDHETYPFVTSSNTVSAQTSIGTGYGYPVAGRVVGVAKAYCTRVGGGPFISEDHKEAGEIMCQKGKEFGTVTGRKRRCGWIDLVALKYAVLTGGITELAITKADIMDDFPVIKACVGYAHKDDGDYVYDSMPVGSDMSNFDPVYVEMPGWKTNTYGVQSYKDLPKEYVDFLEYISHVVGVPVTFISTGAEREHTFKV